MSTHIFSTVALGVGAVGILGVGLLSVLHDLLTRGPYAAPMVSSDDATCSSLYTGAATSKSPADTW